MEQQVGGAKLYIMLAEAFTAEECNAHLPGCDSCTHEVRSTSACPQITTWEEAWPMLKDGGVYICEDTATSMVRIL